MATTVSLGEPSASSICSIFSLCMESTNNNVASKFFARTPSRIRRIVKICEVVDLFLRKPFWFFLSIFSILGFYAVGYIFAAMDARVIPRYFLGIQRSPFLRKGRVHNFVHLTFVFWLYTALQCRSSMWSNSLVFHTSSGYFIKPCYFLTFNFS